MKAIVCPKYGPPEVLQLQEVALPTPKDNEVRVKIVAASVNRSDVEIVSGWVFVRLAGGLRKPAVKILGCDFSGRVDSIGKAVTQFQPSDAVYADLTFRARIPLPSGRDVWRISNALSLE
ncbi:MAG: alcohol dehydrogenase catalytic domain-containing protein [Candidatus Thorarchaeota archaeon]